MVERVARVGQAALGLDGQGARCELLGEFFAERIASGRLTSCCAMIAPMAGSTSVAEKTRQNRRDAARMRWYNTALCAKYATSAGLRCRPCGQDGVLKDRARSALG